MTILSINNAKNVAQLVYKMLILNKYNMLVDNGQKKGTLEQGKTSQCTFCNDYNTFFLNECVLLVNFGDLGQCKVGLFK